MLRLLSSSLLRFADSRFPSRALVYQANTRRLHGLPGSIFEYTAVDEPGINVNGEPHATAWVEAQLDEHTLWPRLLQLKVGATVMLVMVCQRYIKILSD